MKNAFNLVSQQALKMITEIPISQPTNKQKQGKNPTILETTWKQTNKITETSKFSHNNSIFKQSKPSKEKMQIN